LFTVVSGIEYSKFMQITLIQTGKTRFTYLREGVNDYHKRIRHYINFEEITIPDLKNSKNLNAAEIKKKEGEQFLRLIDKAAFLILLDERGKQSSSEEFAEFIRKNMNSGRDIVLIIGGAYGFSEEVYSRANDKFSLSKMTFSHQLVRLIFAEQLYRAMTIIRGEPYHHG
jgi:23S rRNA (pseudouridine1915-N3)-methyltransferase